MKEYEKAVTYISELIANGDVQIGDRLPPERFMAQKLQISRNSIREALMILGNAGVIDARRGSGNYVICETERGLTTIIDIMMLLQQTDKSEIYDFRKKMEIVVCSMILANKNADMNAIEAAAYATDGADAEDRAAKDHDFHRELVKSCGNKLVITITSCLSAIYGKLITNKLSSASPEKLKRYADTHIGIYKGLRNGSIEECIEAIEEHYRLVNEED